jgi:glycerophosphoryl diester phosphodiesterase
MESPHPYLDSIKPIAFAHRGGTSAAPENSMRAFQHAVDLGYRYIETDVHATSDGHVVAFHDNDLQRTCGSSLKIAEASIEELSTARIDGTDPIPLLAEILITWPDMKVNIDCKSDAVVAPLIQQLRSSHCLDRVCIGSFSDQRLARIREEFGSSVCTSMGPREVAALVLGTHARIPLRPTKHALIAQVPVRQGPIPVVTKRTVQRAHALGLYVHVWTIDDPQEIGRLLDLGADGIMSDDTIALRDVFSARGIW